jgi:CRISPR-associated protein Csd1
MLVQALAAYADEYLSEQLNEKAWEKKPVPILIEIAPDGAFMGTIEKTRQETRGKKTITLAQPLLVPRSPVNRNSGLHPLLAADDIKYVLGPGAWTKPKDEQNASERHEAFVELIQKAAEETADAALEACARFYERSDQIQAARDALKDSKPAVLVALSVDGPLVMRPAIRNFWNEHYRKAFEQRMDAGGIGECIVSGRLGPIAPTHEKIKGLSSLGGQPAGVSLMSFDKPAFRSYGWEQNANSPVSPDRAMAYVLALNDLLRSEKHRRDIAGTGFIYWTRKRVQFDPMEIVEQAIPEQVSALLRPEFGADPDPNMFYMAGVAGNGGRLLVRYWLAEALPDVKANLKDWFEGLRITNLSGQVGAPPKLWLLRFAIDREGKPSRERTLALIRRAMEGKAQPLGYDILSALLARLRHPPENKPQGTGIQIDRFAPARLGLLRLCLNDLRQGERQMTEELDYEQNHPAYLCGRLLAEFENLQEAAAGESKINVTVGDRYFSLASTSPGIAFPKIEDLARSHFRKLRRDNPGAKFAIERRVIDLHEKLGAQFPPRLDLDGQGRFALGYYHQKAEKNKQIAEHQEKKAAAGNGADEQEKSQ